MRSDLPALVVLHGHDSTPAEAAALANELDPGGLYLHVTPEGPLETADGRREWFTPAPGTVAATRHALGALFADLAATSPAVVVVGYSQGGAAGLAALTAPDGPRVDAVAVVSGYLGDEPRLEHDLGRLAGTSVLIQHGTADEVVPSFLATDLQGSLEAASVLVEAQWFDIGHERSVASVDALRSWVAKQVAA